MICDSVAHVQTDELPDDLEPSKKSAKMLRMSLQSWHRNRLREVDPLPAYRLGGRWHASRAEVIEWVARRSRPQHEADASALALSMTPTHSRRRQREIENAVKACEARGC